LLLFFEASFSHRLTRVPRGKPSLLHCKKKKPRSALVAKFTALIPDLPPPTRKFFVIFIVLMQFVDQYPWFINEFTKIETQQLP
jgi:hypothetical protein